MNDNYTPVKVDAPIVTTGQNCWQIGSFYVTAQPTDPVGLTAASKLGIQSVICLRDATEVVNPPYLAFDPEEDMTLLGLNISFVNIPFPHSAELTQDQFNARARAVLAVLNELAQPLLIHCSSGDRASALWAVHLMTNCGVSKKDAICYAELSGLAIFKPYVENY